MTQQPLDVDFPTTGEVISEMATLAHKVSADLAHTGYTLKIQRVSGQYAYLRWRGKDSYKVYPTDFDLSALTEEEQIAFLKHQKEIDKLNRAHAAALKLQVG